MRAEDSTRSAAVKPSTFEVRIGDERLDSGDFLEKHEKGSRIHLHQYATERLRNNGEVGGVELSGLILVIEPEPAAPFGIREGREDLWTDGQHLGQNEVWERLGALELAP